MNEHFTMIFQQWNGLFTFCIKGSKYSTTSFIVDEKDLTSEEVGQLMGGN